jgi:hypothetical protein
MNEKLFTAGASLLLMFACSDLDGQTGKVYPEPEKMTHKMTEYWTPQPKVVTPGDAKNQLVAAPSDAIVLFDGKDLSAWENSKGEAAQWTVKDGYFEVKAGTGDIRTKQKFENFQLHVEWRAPKDVKGEGQGRSNSGVFLQGIYEVQILDCYGNETYVNGMTGSIYKQSPPLVNAMRKPGDWNTYDIIYSAPVFKSDGTYRIPPQVTVLHNGIIVQNNFLIRGTTDFVGFPRLERHDAGPITLQDHGDPVNFRNIWIREL